MHTMQRIEEKAKSQRKRIVLPESLDARMLKAAVEVEKRQTATIVLVGSPDEVRSKAKEVGVDLGDMEICDHLSSDSFEKFAEEYHSLRKHKGMTEEQAKQTMEDPLFYGAMMVREKTVDGMVAGAVNSTANVLRATIHIVGTKSGVKTVSSCFLMILPGERSEFGVDGALVYADCGVVPNPNSEQLADIAVATAGSCRELLGVDPQVAMLSFSTNGSASHPDVDKVRQAVEILRERKVDFDFDGEMQADAALIASIGERKFKGSKVAGKANVLIFPDLDAGNIAYKLTERLAGAEAYGPIIQGSALPVNDLSRGCDAQDIVNIVAITAARAIG